MRGDWVSLLLATDEIIPRRADGFGMSVLSERATSLLAFLRSIPDSAACDACMAAHLGVDRYDVLKAIRELVLTGCVMCTFGRARYVWSAGSSPPSELVVTAGDRRELGPDVRRRDNRQG